MNNYQGKKAAVLLSRQPLRPVGTTTWVRQSLEALKWIKGNNMTLRSSVGMLTWDLLTALAGNLGIPVDLIVPAIEQNLQAEAETGIHTDFELNDSAVNFEFIDADQVGELDKRDFEVARGADLLLPVSIRPEGTMGRIIKTTDREIVGTFQIPYSSRQAPISYAVDNTNLSQELRKFEAHCDKYLIHWTRGCNQKWPGETTAQFIRAITASTTYPRSALATLLRILTTRTLLASFRHMPGHEPTVSFTALKPSETIPLMRWRARYREMSFEPYGVGIKLSTAMQIGLRPVTYRQPGNISDEDTDSFWLRQTTGQKTDWRQEKEFRFRVDLDLISIPATDLAAFCRYRSEAARLEAVTGIRIIPIAND